MRKTNELHSSAHSQSGAHLYLVRPPRPLEAWKLCRMRAFCDVLSTCLFAVLFMLKNAGRCTCMLAVVPHKLRGPRVSFPPSLSLLLDASTTCYV